MKKKILSIAGSDSSGGAGIQADITTITKLGHHAMTAVTAITAQDLERVYDTDLVSTQLIKKQIEITLKDAEAIKTGMLGDREIVEVVSQLLPQDIPIVVDPVICSTSGYQLLSTNAIEILKQDLLPKSVIVTPNIHEAEILTGYKITDTRDSIEAGREILKLGPKSVLIKGGHLIQNGKLSDILILNNTEYIFTNDAISTNNTHGTGCKLSAAIASYLAEGIPITENIHKSINYVRGTLAPNEKP